MLCSDYVIRAVGTVALNLTKNWNDRLAMFVVREQ
jgi:hypothetical protein